MKKLDKKQVPQFVALCLLSAGTFGYFVVRLVTPTPAAAGTRPRQVQEAAKPSATTASPSARKTAGATDAASAVAAAPVTAPTAGMRDPFVVGYVDPKSVPAGKPSAAKPAPTQTASIHEVGPAPVTAPFVPSLPLGLKSFSPSTPAPAAILPSAPPALPVAPSWTVTGVLQNDTQHVAILRNGEARRFVRTGDYVDSQFRVVDVTRTAVTLRHGAAVYHLQLGGVKPAPASVKTLAPIPARVLPVPGSFARPQNAATSPARQSASLKDSLASIVESGLTLAQAFFIAIGSRPASPIPAPVTPGSPDQVAMLFPEESPFALDPQTPWQQGQDTNNSDAGRTAETLLTQHH